MCGIVAGISNKNVLPTLIEGLERLEYRGYDSAGIAILNGTIRRIRSIGRVNSIKNKAYEILQIVLNPSRNHELMCYSTENKLGDGCNRGYHRVAPRD